MTPLFESVLFIALVLTLASLVIFAVAKTSKILPVAVATKQPLQPAWIVAAVISIWLAFTAVVAASGAFSNFAESPLRVLLAPLAALPCGS